MTEYKKIPIEEELIVGTKVAIFTREKDFPDSPYEKGKIGEFVAEHSITVALSSGGTWNCHKHHTESVWGGDMCDGFLCVEGPINWKEKLGIK